MKRRSFVESAVLAGAGAAIGGGLAGAAEPARRKLLLPSDKPDKHHLKVMWCNPIAAPDPSAWELTIEGLVNDPLKLRVADLERLARVEQTSRLKCVQCWSARVRWEGFRSAELFKLAGPKPEATFVRIDCADHYYDCVSMEDLLHSRTLFATGMNGEALTLDHGAPLRLVLPSKYGYRSSKLITKLTFTTTGCQGVVADAWPGYYNPSGEIAAGVDRPFDFPGETRNIKGGEILDY